MDQSRYNAVVEILWKFHIWSQGVYPGEIGTYLDSEGTEFLEIEAVFEKLRGEVLEALASKISGDESIYNKLSSAISDKLTFTGDWLRKNMDGFDSNRIYLAYVEMTLDLMATINQTPLGLSNPNF
ncbi:hypothetical protein [Deinococcus sp.]|uniref:hypothetical protein n=1 Tax=Deinococcus sp. TaxID=47478 RepID=UPI003C7A55E3